MDEHESNPLRVDVIVAFHPEHGFVIDGHVAPDIEEDLRRLGYHRNEDNVLALPPDLHGEAARNRHVRAAQLLRVTGHAVIVLDLDDQALALADGAPPPSESSVEEYILAANAYYASKDAVPPVRPTFFPQCGNDKPAASDFNAEHAYADNGVLLVSCAGYYTQNPNAFGISAPNWQDWRNET